MRVLVPISIVVAFSTGAHPAACGAQISIEASYGVSRDVASSPELDGRLNITVDWISPSGLGLGIGTDHQFEDASFSPSEHLSWSLYLTPSYQLPLGAVAPFVRGGIGVGPAPCQSDTCSDGAYLRGSTGIRLRVVDKLRLVAEIGVSRVSRPFATAGASLRL